MKSTDSCQFLLPPGYHDIDLDHIDAMEARMEAELSLVQAESVHRSRHDSHALLDLLRHLHTRHSTHAAFGLHLGNSKELCTSLLTVFDVPTHAPNATLAAARCGIELANSRFGTLLESRIITLACGRPAALATRMLPVVPAEVRDAVGITSDETRVFQARLSVARPEGSRVMLFDLTTRSFSLATEYTEIVLAIGQSVSFADAGRRSPAQVRPSRLEAL